MANLLEEASILLTPTAYDNGSMLAVKPSENLLGDELVANGDFATDSAWSKDPNWSIANGKATSTGAGRMFQSIPFLETNVGTKVVVSFDIVDYTSGGVIIYCYGGLSENFTGVGTHTFTAVTTNTLNLYINNSGQGNLVGSIDNVSVREDLSGDVLFSRNSAATRVNSQGLVENVQILSSDLVSNGDFSQEGVQEVSNGSFSQEGVEEVSNGSFTNGGTDWNLRDAWIVSNGICSLNPPNSNYLSQANVLTANKSYKLTFDIVVNSGSLQPQFFDSGFQTIGTYTTSQSVEVYFLSSSSGTLYFKPNSFDGSIDNVSVKEVGQDWVLGGGVIIADSKLTKNDPSVGNTSASQGGFVVGKTYKYKLVVSGNITASNKIVAFTSEFTSAGTYEGYWVANSSSLVFSLRGSTNIYSIDSVSVKEVGQDWTLGTGWSIGDSVATIDNTVNANLDQTALVSGKKYKVSFEISDLQVGGNITIGDIVTPSAYIATSNGIQTFNYSATNPTLRVRGKGYPCSITNISVVEITDDTNLPRINYKGFSYQDSLGSEKVVNGSFSNGVSDWAAGGGAALSVSNNQLTIEADNDFNVYARQDVQGFEVGKKYKVEIDVAGGSTSKMQVSFYGEGVVIDNQPVVIGKQSVIVTVTNLADGARFIDIINRNDDVLDDTLIINSVSVKEYLGQEVVPDSGCGSWLLEQQSTNTITHSEDFSNSFYIKDSGVSLGSSNNTSPSGETNATQINVTDNGRIYANTTSNTYYTSVFIKAGTFSYFKFLTGNIDLVAKTNSNGSIEDYGNGWFRIGVAVTSVRPFQIQAYPDGTYAPHTTAGSYYIWGAQLEVQSFATSYIPTSGATSTRLKDIATNSGNASLINSEQGVFYAEISYLANDSTFKLISLNNNLSNSSNNAITIGFSNGNNLYLRIVVNGTAILSSTNISATKNQYYKVAIKFNSLGNNAIWIDGVEVLSNTTSFTYPVIIDNLSFDYNSNGGLPFYGKTKALAIFKTALTDEQLTALTTI